MNDSDQPGATAPGPYRQEGDEDQNQRSGLFSRLMARLTGRGPNARDDLRKAIEDQSADVFSAGERALIENVLNLANVRVDDVMVPRADIDAVDANDTIAELIREFREAEHSRLPVFEETLDHVTGMVHIKDVIATLSEDGPPRADGTPGIKLKSAMLRSRIGRADLIRSVLYVPPSMPVSDLLQSMQATRIHMAIVVDEYGGTDGLVTLEDLLESVVGDIEDEHDDDDADLVRQAGDGVFVADARAGLDELIEVIGADFDGGSHGEEVDTLGGLLFNVLGRVPVRGEVIRQLRGYEIEIMQADPRRIRKVRITRRRRAARARPVAEGNGAVLPPAPHAPEPAEVSDAPAPRAAGTPPPRPKVEGAEPDGKS